MGIHAGDNIIIEATLKIIGIGSGDETVIGLGLLSKVVANTLHKGYIKQNGSFFLFMLQRQERL